MSGYPGGGGYPGNQGGGYPGNQVGYPGQPGQGGYPSGPQGGAGYPGANNPQGGYPGGQGGYPGGQGGGYPSGGPRPAGPQGGQGGGYPAGGPRPAGPPGGQMGAYPAGQGQGGYPRPQVQVDPSVQQWFSAVDSDRSGHINAQELQRALVNGNWSNFSEEACRMMIEMYDRDGSGTIDVTEFQQLFNSINQWRGIFQGFDTDRSGTIEQGELTKAFQQMGYSFTNSFIDRLLSKYDKRTKKLTLDNFIVVNSQIKRLSDGFRHRDSMRNGQATMQYEDFIGLAMGVHQ